METDENEGDIGRDEAAISLSLQARILVDAYDEDSDFQSAFGRDTTITRFHLFLIFLHFCSANRLYGFPSQVILEAGRAVGLANFQNENAPLDGTWLDFAYFGLFRTLYRRLLTPIIRNRLERYTEISNDIRDDLNAYELCQIGVRKAARHKGYLKRLLGAVERIARQDQKVDALTVTTFSENKSAMYENLGFKIFGHVQDTDVDVWVLKRPLA